MRIESVEVWFFILSTSTLDDGEWLNSGFGLFVPDKYTISYWISSC
jgi:hypothetical protein